MTKISALFFQTWTRYELASTRLIKINCVFGCQKIAAGAIQHFAPLIHHLMTDNVPNLLKTKSSGKTIWVLFKNVSKKTPSTWHNSSAPLQKSVKVNWTELWLRIRVIFELLLLCFFNYYRRKFIFFHICKWKFEINSNFISQIASFWRKQKRDWSWAFLY